MVGSEKNMDSKYENPFITKKTEEKKEELIDKKSNSDILTLLKNCLSYEEEVKQELKDMTSNYFKKGLFAKYEVTKALYMEKCEHIYSLEEKIESLEEIKEETNGLLHFADIINGKEDSHSSCGCGCGK